MKIGIMVEGQEDMTWARFFRLAERVEALGFESLFRSDHLTALNAFPERASLALWPSLTALAMRTRRIRFGPLVCPMTFRHPAMLAKMAAAVYELSEGRLDLGIGAGWFAGEHRMFGIPYPPYAARLEMLDEGARVLQSLFSGQPATWQGAHYRLEAAETHPAPGSQAIPIIIGGSGEKTLQLVARYADEWNFAYRGVEAYRQKALALEAACQAEGRDPETIRHSLMIPFVIAEDPPDLQARIDAQRRTFSDLPTSPQDWGEAGFIGGPPDQVVEQLRTFAQAGIERFMLQHNDLDDMESLELLSTRVLPYVDVPA